MSCVGFDRGGEGVSSCCSVLRTIIPSAEAEGGGGETNLATFADPSFETHLNVRSSRLVLSPTPSESVLEDVLHANLS